LAAFRPLRAALLILEAVRGYMWTHCAAERSKMCASCASTHWYENLPLRALIPAKRLWKGKASQDHCVH